MNVDIAFNRTKRIVESTEIKTHFDCLRTIVLNISEACNLKCSMCPRNSGYPNRHEFMSIDTAIEIAHQLHMNKYNGLISISGMGEPCLHPDLIGICKVLQGFNLQVITNGTIDIDYKTLTQYAQLLISVHNWNDIDKLKDRFASLPVIFRNHDLTSPMSELKITNRGGWTNKETVSGICNFPFYKMLIDIDGSYLLCADDWKRSSLKKDLNIFNMNIYDYFCNYLSEIKNKMLTEGRLQNNTCKLCSADGKLIGSNAVEWYRKNVYQR